MKLRSTGPPAEPIVPGPGDGIARQQIEPRARVPLDGERRAPVARDAVGVESGDEAEAIEAPVGAGLDGQQ